MTAAIHSMPELLAQSDARTRGLKHYFTGKPCKHGHVAKRYVATGICFECGKMHKASEQNRRMANARVKRKNAKNPQPNRDRVKAWRKANPEKRKLQTKREEKSHTVWRKKNAAKLNALQREARKANPHSHRINAKNRKARLRRAIGRYCLDDIKEIRKAQRNKCAYCRTKLIDGQWHVDHILPISSGGSNWPANIQIACASCNLSKGRSDPIKYANRIGMLL